MATPPEAQTMQYASNPEDPSFVDKYHSTQWAMRDCLQLALFFRNTRPDNPLLKLDKNILANIMGEVKNTYDPCDGCGLHTHRACLVSVGHLKRKHKKRDYQVESVKWERYCTECEDMLEDLNNRW